MDVVMAGDRFGSVLRSPWTTSVVLIGATVAYFICLSPASVFASVEQGHFAKKLLERALFRSLKFLEGGVINRFQRLIAPLDRISKDGLRRLHHRRLVILCPP
jgi:hypothetical protein